MAVKDELIELVRGKKVYCYGAGEYGKIVAYALQDMNIFLEGFIVTHNINHMKAVLGKPVWELDAIESLDNAIILICVNNMIQREIKGELYKRNIKNWYILSETMMEELDNTTVFDKEVDTNRYINVLLYHRVCHIENDIWKIAVSPEEFEKQVKYLKEHYNILRFDEDWSNVREKSIVITFDDGYVDNYKFAVPILKKYQVPATIFISTGNIDTDYEFWWDELETIIFNCNNLQILTYAGDDFYLNSAQEKKICCQQIRKKMMGMRIDQREKELIELRKRVGVDRSQRSLYRTMGLKEIQELSRIEEITIGAHTKTHCRLSDLPENLQLEEINQSKQTLEKIIGREVTTFSYPFGNSGDYTMQTIRAVKKCGFIRAAAVNGGLYLASQGEYEVPRNNIPGEIKLEAFKKLLRKHWYEYGT